MKVNYKFKSLCLSVFVTSILISSCSTPNNTNNSNNNSIKSNSLFDLDITKNYFGQTNLSDQNSFQWGVSTAGYQGEGYDTSSIWHQWDVAGKSPDHNPRGVDFLNRYQEDIDLAKNMGINSFRISIEWSRIEPKEGQYDPNGIQFYHNLINAIKAKGMTPLVTLVHFNYPQWVINRSSDGRKGVESPDFVELYLKYVQKVVTEFAPDVKYWLTFNEPNIWIPGAYLVGQTPPGRKNPFATIRATWNLLKAHAKAYDLIHQIEPDAMVSSNVFYILPKPFGPVTPPDLIDPKNIVPRVIDEKNIMETDWFYEAAATGNVAVSSKVFVKDGQQQQENTPTTYKTLAQEMQETDNLNRKIKNPVNIETDSGVQWLEKFDYVAFDYYYRFRNLSQIMNLTRPWLEENYPEGIYDAIMLYQNKYHKPIIIAENGISTENLKPRADRWTREASIVQHIKYMKKAIADGANVIGYYHWSITDNYEWGSYTPRFGLYTVNAKTDPTMKRIPTPAVAVYAEIIKNNGLTDDLLRKYKGPVN